MAEPVTVKIHNNVSSSDTMDHSPVKRYSTRSRLQLNSSNTSLPTREKAVTGKRTRMPVENEPQQSPIGTKRLKSMQSRRYNVAESPTPSLESELWVFRSERSRSSCSHFRGGRDIHTSPNFFAMYRWMVICTWTSAPLATLISSGFTAQTEHFQGLHIPPCDVFAQTNGSTFWLQKSLKHLLLVWQLCGCVCLEDFAQSTAPKLPISLICHVLFTFRTIDGRSSTSRLAGGLESIFITLM